MSFSIDIQNEDDYPVEPARLEAAALAVLSRYELPPDSGLSIVITSDEAVQALNLQHRQIDAPTDVLSFTADPLPPELGEEAAPYLGDLVIAFPYAQSQALREGHELMDSLSLLVVHGTLHLLGYDHDTLENKAEMWQEQAETLQELNIDPAIVPALEGPADDE